MFRVGEKIVYIKQSYTGLKLASIHIIKDIRFDTSISLEDSYKNWWFSSECFISLSEYRKQKLNELKKIS